MRFVEQIEATSAVTVGQSITKHFRHVSDGFLLKWGSGNMSLKSQLNNYIPMGNRQTCGSIVIRLEWIFPEKGQIAVSIPIS
jgi:hypothetical protein